MKKIIIIFVIALLFAISFTASAQNTILKTDISEHQTFAIAKYNQIFLTDNENRKFTGKWVCQTDNQKFTIELQNDVVVSGKISADKLKGIFTLIINGSPATLSSDNTIIGSTNGKPSTARIGIFNKVTHAEAIYLLTYINSNTIRFELSKNERREWKKNSNEFSLPIDITMHKE